MFQPQDSLSSSAADSVTPVTAGVVAAEKEAVSTEKKNREQPDTQLVVKPGNFFETTFTAKMLPMQKKGDPDSWIIPLLLGVFFLAGIINTFFFRSSRALFLALFKRDGLRKLMEEDNMLLRRALTLCLLLFLIILPVFVYQVTSYFHLTTAFLPFIPAYAQLLLVCAGAVGLKAMIINGLGHLFDCMKEARNYNLGILVMCCLLGLLYIPVALAIKLSPTELSSWFLLGGLVITAFAYLVSLLIGLSTGLRSAVVSKFHLILYFCTLEIIPVFLIIKAVKNSV